MWTIPSSSTFESARKLVLHDRWRLWLSPNEGRIFLQVCKDESTWNSFLEGRHARQGSSDRRQFPDDTSVLIENQSDDLASGEHGVDFHIQAAFRIRQMLFEQSIPELYPQYKDQSTAVLDKELLGDELSIGGFAPRQNGKLSKNKKYMDDDYDSPESSEQQSWA